jgi:DNA modification methylase
MKITNVPIGDLNEADYNPRQMTDKQVADLTASLKEFGLVDPIIVNGHVGRKNIIVGGHQRFKIAKILGFTEIPVVYVDLPLDQEKRLNLRLNRNNGEWNWDALANNFDIETLIDVGFDKADLSVFDLSEDEFNEEEELGRVSDPKVKDGDVFLCGDHTILCGDSTDPASFTNLMAGAKARLLFTDPPYGVSYVSGAAKGKGATKKHAKIANDDLRGDKLDAFLHVCFKNAFDVCTNDATFYSWFSNSNQTEFRNSMEQAGWQYAQVVIWIKNRFVLSRSDYHHCYEPCMYGWKKGETHFSNKKMRSFDDLILLDQNTFQDQLDAWYISRDSLASYEHPTQKPVRLADRALKMSTVNGDIVLDPFAGSFSTLIACEQAGRKGYLIEMDPKYVHVGLSRWAKFTGQDPVRKSDGVSWSTINS